MTSLAVDGIRLIPPGNDTDFSSSEKSQSESYHSFTENATIKIYNERIVNNPKAGKKAESMDENRTPIQKTNINGLRRGGMFANYGEWFAAGEGKIDKKREYTQKIEKRC